MFFLSALKKPDSVTNVTLDSLVYDSASPGDKIKLTVSWNPSEGRPITTKLKSSFRIQPLVLDLR